MSRYNKYIINIGDKFSFLTVISKQRYDVVNNYKNKATVVDCVCECGKKIVCHKSELIRGNKKSCNKKCPIAHPITLSPDRYLIKIGESYGKLKVIDNPFIHQERKEQYVKCRCECGNEKVMYVWGIKNGKSKTCGCGSADSRRRGTLAKDGKKQCARCQKIFKIDKFGPHKSTKDGLQHSCKECEYYRIIKTRYKLSDEQIDWIKGLNKKCMICKKKLKRFYLDHCHDTGKIRGILCQQCNSMLGMAKDSIEILQGGIEYLKNNGQ